MRELGFDVSIRKRTLSGARTRQRRKPLYEQLKAAHVLVRYMNYPGWGDGLRISVGTDEQIDALLGRAVSGIDASPKWHLHATE